MEEKLDKLVELIAGVKDEKAKEALSVILDVLNDTFTEIEDINDDLDSIDEAFQLFDEDLAAVEEAVFGEGGHDHDHDHDHDHHHHHHHGDDCEEELEVACPNCGVLIPLESADIERIECPNCKVMISVEYDEDDIDE